MDVLKVQNPDLAQAIEWTKETIETMITRSFTNAAVRRSIWSNAPAKQHPLKDVFFTVKGDTHVELTNLKLLREPDFRFTSVTARFEFLFLAAEIDVGDLEVSGEFFVQNTALNAFLPLTTSGQISIIFKNVKAKGSIGVYPIEDCFLTNNSYAIEYKPEKVLIKTTYRDSEGEISGQLDRDELSDTLGAHLWMDLTSRLNHLLKMELDEVIVELSACDLLQGESDLVDAITEHSKAVNVVTNDIFDKILANANNRINELKVSTIPTPDIDASFTKKLAGVVTTGRFTARNGIFQNLATISRKGNVSIAVEDGNIVIFGTVGLAELKISYDHYEAKLMDVGPTGAIQTTVGRNEALFKFVLDKKDQDVKIRLADFKITNISDVEAHVTGLGGLNWLASKISSWMASTLRWKVAPVIEARVKENINKVLEDFNVSALLTK
ncbi:uncharacterized protein LOC124181162 isoform X1 [Neodiprion fabricii]|uniref:uncharacterized protein LOC124181162 isoform X1 n=1 Tax=Neodiprion fabricii TaxID=2872261 RepID=UPI001ED93967|nr:uncharacterized protein LOC124181162 isoform X1 [Neodiprion fabricii]